MKHVFLFLCAGCMMFAAGCVDFPTSYSVIETDKPRLLDFIYEPAEAAPGDTVHVTALFAGKAVSAADLEWSMSRKIIMNEYGSRTALDTVPLDVIYDDRTFTDSTNCFSFSFIIPPETLKESPAIPDRWTDLLPDYYRSAIPSAVPSSKSAILAFLDEASVLQGTQQPENDAAMAPFIPMVLQLFSAPIYIFCDVKNSHLIRSTYIVRYNRRFATMPELDIPVNNNPSIDSMFLYTVDKGDLALFDPHTDTHSFTRTVLRTDTVNTLTIDRDKSYFIGIYNSCIDSTMSIDAAMGEGSWLTETVYSHWYVHYRDNEKKRVGQSKLMTVEDGVMYDHLVVSKFYPSLDDAITEAVLWVELDDGFLNEMNRPTGSTLGELRLSFSYCK